MLGNPPQAVDRLLTFSADLCAAHEPAFSIDLTKLSNTQARLTVTKVNPLTVVAAGKFLHPELSEKSTRLAGPRSINGPALIGVDISGHPVYLDIMKHIHGMICGPSGGGKGNTAMIFLLHALQCVDLQATLIDLEKGGGLSDFARSRHALHSYLATSDDRQVSEAIGRWREECASVRALLDPDNPVAKIVPTVTTPGRLLVVDGAAALGSKSEAQLASALGEVRAYAGRIIITRFTNRAGGQSAQMRERRGMLGWTIWTGAIGNDDDYVSVMGEFPTPRIRAHLAYKRGAAVLRCGDTLTLFRVFYGGDGEDERAPIFLAFDELSRRAKAAKSAGAEPSLTRPTDDANAAQGQTEGQGPPDRGSNRGSNLDVLPSIGPAQHARETDPPIGGLLLDAWRHLSTGPLPQSTLVERLGCSAPTFRAHVRDNPDAGRWVEQIVTDRNRGAVSWRRRTQSQTATAA
jgi:hypothetical protein